MWFCEMRQAPRLRDCAGELAARAVRRARDVLTALKDRCAAARDRVEWLAPAAARSRLARRVRPVA